jgi:hypothetical protein
MHTHTAIALAVVTSCTLAAAVAAQGPRRDGKWEVKMEMDMPGMPAAMPPMNTTQCVTKEEANDPQKAVPQGGRGRGGAEACKVSDYKVEGNKVSWSMKCDPPQAMTGTGEFTYSGDTYVGVMKMDRGGQVMTMKYTGKRVGECDKQP